MHKNPKLLNLKSYTAWMLATLPANIAYAPLATFVPLYVLALGGNALGVAIAVAGFNVVAMCSSFFWGRVIDATGKRKPVILLTYACITLFLFAMYFSDSLYEVFLLYAAIAVFQPATPISYNLLVMETDAQGNWSRNFSRLQAISNIGMVAGLIIAAAITQFTTLKILLLIFAAASVASTITAFFIVVEPKVSVKLGESLRGRINGAIFTMVGYPARLIRISNPLRLVRTADPYRAIRVLRHPFSLLCISWLVFNVGMSMFNTEYSASLHLNGLSEAGVFDVILVAMVAQTILFYYAQRFVNREKLPQTTASMISLRGISYVVTALSFLITGALFFASNMVTYFLVAGISYPIYYTASYMMLFNAIGAGRRGNAIGVYNGIGWIGYFIGSVFDGALLGYGFTALYLITALFIFASIYPLRVKPHAPDGQGIPGVTAQAGPN